MIQQRGGLTSHGASCMFNCKTAEALCSDGPDQQQANRIKAAVQTVCKQEALTYGLTQGLLVG